MAIVTLYVQGEKDQVTEKLKELQEALGEWTVVWWRTEQGPESGGAEFDPWVDVEIQKANRRPEAVAHVIKAVQVVDPNNEIITGGDIFKKPIREH